MIKFLGYVGVDGVIVPGRDRVTTPGGGDRRILEEGFVFFPVPG